MPPAAFKSKPPAPSFARSVSAPPRGIQLPSQVYLSAEGTVEGVPYLGTRELVILRFIYKYLLERRYYPTRVEIAAGVLATKKSGPASPYLRRLIALGYLTLSPPLGHRNLRLTAAALERLVLESTDENTQLNFSLPNIQ